MMKRILSMLLAVVMVLSTTVMAAPFQVSTVETAKEVLKLGMYIGFGGALTFKNARKALEVAEMLPLDKLLLETDCPYMAPVPMRGKRNDSSLIPYVAEKMAEIKNTDAQSVLDIATKNTKKLFNI